MEWKPLSQEEAKGLQFSSKTGKESPYKAILDATEKAPVKVSVSGTQTLQSLKWALSSQIKKAGLNIVMATLADKTGVVLTREAGEALKK
jgi:hypothetical protein